MNFKKHESGRSMVEMLGVLAIIGVLSVGGIAGYSLSMRRHRANAVIDIASKYALTAYSACQQRVLNGETVSSCNAGSTSHNSKGYIYLPFENAGIGALPAGVTGYSSWYIEMHAATGIDTVYMKVEFSDQKLCQAVGSIADIGYNGCSNNSSYLEIKFKQN